MKNDLKYFKKADAVASLCGNCIRYVFPTTAEPFEEFIKLDDAVRVLRLVECEDVEPVVRCKECMYSETDDMGFYYCVHDIIGGYGATLDADTFCSYGERKDDDKSCDTCKRYDKWWDDIVCDGCTKAYSNWERKDDE